MGSSPHARVPPAVDTASSPAIIAPQPKQRRKGRKSMCRRNGQNGTVVIAEIGIGSDGVWMSKVSKNEST